MGKKFKGRLGSRGPTPDGPTRRFKGNKLKKGGKAKRSDSQVSGRKGTRRMERETKQGIRPDQMSVHRKGGKPAARKSKYKVTRVQPTESAGGPSNAKHRK